MPDTNEMCATIDMTGETTIPRTGEIAMPVTPVKRPRSDSLENPFLVPFTPSKRMKILRAGLASDSKTSYLVSSYPVTGETRVIMPQRERPEPFSEPSWSTLLDPDVGHLDQGGLIQEVIKLRGGLQMARDCIRAGEAVIESAHATNVVLELTCQRQRLALNWKKTEKLQKKDKRSLFSDGKAHVVTDDDFINALEAIEELEKEKEGEKERRKLARVKVKESKEAEKKAWDQAVEEWKGEREEWEEERTRLVEQGHRKRDLPRAPKRPKKADILAAMLDQNKDSNSDGGDSEADTEVSDDADEQDGPGVNDVDEGGEDGEDDDGKDGDGED